MTQTTSQTKDLVDKAFDIPEIRITDEYGINTNKLKPGLNIEDNGGGNVKTIIFTRLATVGTGNQSFTGFGFTPTSYQIKAWRSGSSAVATWSTGGYNTTNYCLQLADGGSNDVSSSNYVLRVFYTNQGGDRTSATHISFDSDGITLNFNYSGENIVMEITAY